MGSNVVFAILFLADASLVRRHSAGDDVANVTKPLEIAGTYCNEGQFVSHHCGEKGAPEGNKVLQDLLAYSAISVDGTEYGKKAQTNYQAVYTFFKRNPELTAYLSLDVLDALYRAIRFDDGAGSNRSRQWTELGKTFYMQFSTVQPFVTVYMHKDSLKLRFELNQARQICDATSGAPWLYAAQTTNKKTVRQIVSNKHFKECDGQNGDIVASLIVRVEAAHSRVKRAACLNELKGEFETTASVPAANKACTDELIADIMMSWWFKKLRKDRKQYLEDMVLEWIDPELALPDRYFLSTRDFFYILNKLCPQSSVRDSVECKRYGQHETFSAHQATLHHARARVDTERTVGLETTRL